MFCTIERIATGEEAVVREMGAKAGGGHKFELWIDLLTKGIGCTKPDDFKIKITLGDRETCIMLRAMFFATTQVTTDHNGLLFRKYVGHRVGHFFIK